MTKKDPEQLSPGGIEVYRSPGAVVIWWIWVLFALANLIDLAVQGRDHLAVVAAFILLLVTGVVYVTALRPRVIAGPESLTVVNPVTGHRIGWAAVAGADPTDLLRIRCEWPEGEQTRQRVIYAWAVHSSRRRQLSTELRAQRQTRRGGAGGGMLGGAFGGSIRGGGSLGWGSLSGPGGTGAAGTDPEGDSDPLRMDAGKVVAALTERAEQARQAAPGERATAPVSAWHWAPVAVVLVPALALLAAVLT